MKKKLISSLLLLGGFSISQFPAAASAEPQTQSSRQTVTVTGTVVDENGEPAIGANIKEKGHRSGVATTDIDGKFSIRCQAGAILKISYIGYHTIEAAASDGMVVTLHPDATNLEEVVVTAMGVRKDKKSLGYAIDDIAADELMKNKTANALNSLSGKIAGVNITQSSGAAGAGAQIILRGGTSLSETRDNQPLFVVDGIIYDNSTSVGGNSAFDGSLSSATTSSNRVMDINPEDIENMSVLKGPAASALYGSRAANGVVLITTKKGKSGNVEVNFSTRYTTSWVKDVPKAQTTFGRGVIMEQYDADKNYIGSVLDPNKYKSWGLRNDENAVTYDNLDGFFQNGGIWDSTISVAGGNDSGNFYLSGSYFDQDGVVKRTGYTKTAFRFNGEQRWKIFTFGANAAYTESRTDKTLTSSGLHDSKGSGAIQRLYTFGTSDDMGYYEDEAGKRVSLVSGLSPWEEEDNPYWILNRTKLHDKTTRFTGSINIKADLASWWWVNFRMGTDNYTTDFSKFISPGSVTKSEWQDGMMSDNTTRYNYITTNLMTNFSKTFGDFGLNLLLGTSTDNTSVKSTGLMGTHFIIPGFYSYNNVAKEDLRSLYQKSRKRLVGVYGEFRADWKSTVFLTVTGRNDWTSTLPKANRSYFYPSVSGAVVFTQFLQDHGWLGGDSFLTFGKIRASWAKVGKDTSPYETLTTLSPIGGFIGDMQGAGNSIQQGNNLLKPEMTKSAEIGVELRFFNNRLKLDYAYYTNDSNNQILVPRTSQATGFIKNSLNAGNVLNKGMELAISGVPVQTKDWTWETSINMAGNRGRIENLVAGLDLLYLTDVQYGSAKAVSFNNGTFMAIGGTKWTRVPEGEHKGKVILDAKGMPSCDTNSTLEIANREPKFIGGWNNSLRWKDFTFNMLWEFSVGGAVFNGTKWKMTEYGTSQFSADVRQQPLTIDGVVKLADGSYEERHYEYQPDQIYNYNGVPTLGYNIIKDYYTTYYPRETANYVTKVNSLRLRSISLSYDVPRTLLAKTKAIKRAVVTASATNLLLFTNYDGDPEVAASGAGVGGSSSVGFDYCGVPATASFAFGINLTF